MVRLNKTRTRLGKPGQFVRTLRTEQLRGLAEELYGVRSFPPLTKRKDGKYEGDILGFVKGLRFSARVIYFLREQLSGTDLEVSWGHLVDSDGQFCSPECDIIIHTKGHYRKWNGNGGTAPVMEFKFIEAKNAVAVVSCKSELRSVDDDYPVGLRKFGVKHVLLFAECCAKQRLVRLRRRARTSGYRGLWVLYYLDDTAGSYEIDEKMHFDFGQRILRIATG